ncbi:MAG: cellulase [Acidobacteria bacterium]|nr:cellulase [Acidobacteriota bacterium]
MGLAASWKRCAVVLALTGTVMLQGCRAQEKWPLWTNYSDKFVDAQSGRVIDHIADDKTTSEGMAYAMFFALVVNDQKRFDKLLRWTEDNLAGGDLTARLPAWSWGKNPDGSWKVIDSNSASDADLWLAYDLLEAGRLWKIHNYENLGAVIADRVAKTEVKNIPSIGTVLVPGAAGFHLSEKTYVLNPSYTPPQVLARLAQYSKQPWGSIASDYPQLLARGSGGGFAMDWISAGDVVRPSPPPNELAAGKRDAVAVGSYDAIRVYLWLGMANKDTLGVEESLPAVNGMSAYLKDHMIPPLQVDATGKVLNDAGTVGFSAAVIPYLLATGHKTEANQQMKRLAASLNEQTGLYGNSPTYYDQNLAMFATGWMEKRFWFDKNGELHTKWHPK